MKTDIFTKQILSGTIQLKPLEQNSGIDETILEKLRDKIEGKCDSFGYIKPDSVKVLKRSIGMCQPGQFNGNCNYKIAYSVEVCNPMEGMIIKCIVKNINKMGLFAEMADMEPSPVSVILAKQHHMDESKDAFDAVKINDVINVEVVGKKFNYNDTIISCIGKLNHDDLTMEEKAEMPDSNVEVEMDLELNESLGDDPENLSGIESDVDSDLDTATDDNSANEDEVPEGLTLEKDLQQQESDVLEELKQLPTEDGEDLVQNEDMNDMEGVQDLESVELVSQSVDGAPKTDVHSYEMEPADDLEELGMEFEGETVSLDDLSSASLKPVYNEDKFEKMTQKPGKEVFDLEILSHPKYKTFSRPIKNTKKFLKYVIYVQLNNMMIKFYELNEVAPKKVFLNKDHPHLEDMKSYLSAMGKSLQVEEVEGTSYVN